MAQALLNGRVLGLSAAPHEDQRKENPHARSGCAMCLCPARTETRTILSLKHRGPAHPDVLSLHQLNDNIKRVVPTVVDTHRLEPTVEIPIAECAR